MTLEKLKRRIRKEWLDQYFTYRFDIWGSRYIAMHIRKNSNGTVDYSFTNERGSIKAEHLNLPEAEACDEIYKYAVGQKVLRGWEKQQLEKMAKT